MSSHTASGGKTDTLATCYSADFCYVLEVGRLPVEPLFCGSQRDGAKHTADTNDLQGRCVNGFVTNLPVIKK